VYLDGELLFGLHILDEIDARHIRALHMYMHYKDTQGGKSFLSVRSVFIQSIHVYSLHTYKV
jgi:hypothetical protein